MPPPNPSTPMPLGLAVTSPPTARVVPDVAVALPETAAVVLPLAPLTPPQEAVLGAPTKPITPAQPLGFVAWPCMATPVRKLPVAALDVDARRAPPAPLWFTFTIWLDVLPLKLPAPATSSLTAGVVVPMPTFIDIVLSPSTMQLLQFTSALAPIAVALVS